jgi:hypothetical protein
VDAQVKVDASDAAVNPHILLVPQTAVLQMKSSDHVLHTVQLPRLICHFRSRIG